MTSNALFFVRLAYFHIRSKFEGVIGGMTPILKRIFDPDLFSLNRFMTIEQQYTTVAFIEFILIYFSGNYFFFREK